MKQIRSDRTAIYYWRAREGGFTGVRIGRTHSWVITGKSPNPEQLLIVGPGNQIPLPPGEDIRQSFTDVRLLLAGEHPEVERLLRGEMSFDDALN